MSGPPSLLLGLIGAGIQASLTPALHEHEAGAQGLRCLYRLIDLDRLGLDGGALPDLLTAAERMGFTGLNITYPCKQTAIPLLHALSDEARALGAVNTVVLRDGRRVGHNTDCFGFADNVRRHFGDFSGARVVQLGAGGAGAAVAHATLTLGADHLALFDIDAARAERLAADLTARFGAGRATAIADPAAALATADGLVNTTPIGMARFPALPLDPAALRPALFVADIVYVPIETKLLAAARAQGCRTLDGGGMAVAQAAEAFRLFSGRAADLDRMARHFASLRDARGT